MGESINISWTDGTWSCTMCGGVHRIGESHAQAMARAKPEIVKQTPSWRPGDKP